MDAIRPSHAMPSERKTVLYLNGAELLRIQATPANLDDWAVGFLFSEGIISGITEVRSLAVNTASAEIKVEVDPASLPEEAVSAKRYLTSGCGKGVTFSSLKDAMSLRPVDHDLGVGRVQLVAWIKSMQRQSPLYAETGGMHAAAAVHVPSGEVLVREDIGRHNAVDKAIGAALRAGWALSDCALLTTGRLSYEMCAKLGRAGIGVGASLSAATDQAIRLADRLRIDLAGYARTPDRLVVYTHSGRIG